MLERIRFRDAFAGAVLALGLAAPPAGAQYLTPEKEFYVTDDWVGPIEVVGDSVYVGGTFTRVGFFTGPAAPVAISTGETLPEFPEANDSVFGLAADGSGGWFVGGDFTEIGGLARSHVAHVLPDFTVDPDWDANANNRVYGFAVHDSTVYMHGFFFEVGGESRSRLAAVDLATGALREWDPAPQNGGVEDFWLDGDTLYVTGSFTAIGGQPRRLAAFDLTTGDLMPFDPVFGNQGLCIAARDGVVYVGGNFTAIGDSTRTKLAAFDASTSELLPWAPQIIGSSVLDLALTDSTIFAAGAFSSVNGTFRNAIAEMSLADAQLTSFEQNNVGFIRRLLYHAGNIYVGGEYRGIGAEPERRFLAGFDVATGASIPTVPSPTDFVHALAADGDVLYVGGDFGAVRGIIRNHFAAFHANTLELLPFAPSFENYIYSMEANAAGDTLYTAGRFTSVDGQPRGKIASFDLASGTLTSFSTTFDGDVYDISLTDSLVYAGGTYTFANGVLRQDLACLNRVTGALLPWNPGSGGFVNAVAAYRDTVYVGGSFFTLGDSTRTNIGAVDGITGEVLDWGTQLDVGNPNEIESLLPFEHPSYPQGGLFMGGSFLNTGIGLRRGVAAVHRDTGNALYGWNANLGTSFETEVYDYEIVDGLVFLAGQFNGVLSNDARGVTAVDLVTGRPNDWVVDFGVALGVAVSDSMVFVGGRAPRIQGTKHTHFAAFRRDTEAPSPATSLVATPGTLDKRIDLSWSASPSSDVKDYLVYRTGAAGADTTGRQVAVRTGTTWTDIVPTYGEWFYRVFARDQAHNLSNASNEDSAVAAPIAGPDPEVTIAIHQNPVLSQHANVVLVSDSTLVAPPAVSVALLPDTTGTTVSMAAIAGSGTTYQGPYEFSTSGNHRLRTTVTTIDGTFEFARDFAAVLVAPATGGEARSVGGLATLRIAAHALDVPTWFVLEEIPNVEGARAIRCGPAGALATTVEIEMTYDPEEVRDPSSLSLARREGDDLVPLATELDAARSVVRARVDRLGEFVLRRTPGDLGGALRRLSMEPGRPNPFRATTTLQYDLPTASTCRVSIYDVKGRRVRVLHDGPAPAGTNRVDWNGRDDRGARVAAGVYFARVVTPGEERSVKLVRVR
ncbi:MAG: FlgD immunoglobulin-like domain containing protein [bacterium]